MCIIKYVLVCVFRIHGRPSSCPFPRVLPNLVSACLAGLLAIYDLRKRCATLRVESQPFTEARFSNEEPWMQYFWSTVSLREHWAPHWITYSTQCLWDHCDPYYRLMNRYVFLLGSTSGVLSESHVVCRTSLKPHITTLTVDTCRPFKANTAHFGAGTSLSLVMKNIINLQRIRNIRIKPSIWMHQAGQKNYLY